MEDREHVIQSVKKDVLEVTGTRLQSLILYGSAMTEEFVDQRSDYNFAVVVDKVDIPLLDDFRKFVRGWADQRVRVPLLFAPKFFEQARDSFPLEFLAMKASYRVVEGKDLVANLEIDPRDVRLECEWELRSKLIALRRIYIEADGNAEWLQRTIVEAVPALTAIFRGLLFIANGDWRLNGSALYAELDRKLGIPADLMQRLAQTRQQHPTPKTSEVMDEFRGLLPLLERLVDEVDAAETRPGPA